MSDPSPENVISFWLDEIGPKGWYVQDDALDSAITERFGPLWQKAEADRIDDWADTPRGALALLIVMDQFPRNMFREDGKAFSTDAQALGLAKRSVVEGFDLQIDNPARQFFYLPYMHSEDLTDQHACVALIRERGPQDNLFHALAHRAVIERFGRFPYRNAALGREDTPEERAYKEAGLYAPEGWKAPAAKAPIEVYLTVSGAKKATDWYASAFGAMETGRMEAEDGQRLLYARLEMFGGAIMLADAFPEMAATIIAPDVAGSTGVTITVNTGTPDDVDRIIEQAAGQDATVAMPAADMFWGSRYGQVIDPFGHRWAFSGPETKGESQNG